MQGRNQSETQHSKLSDVIAALQAALTLGMRDVTVTTVPQEGTTELPASFIYHVEALARSPREALEEQHNLFTQAANQ